MVTIPSWLKCYLRESDLQKVYHSIQLAEQKSFAEFVPMIVRRSSSIGHVQPLIFWILMTISMSAVSVEHLLWENQSISMQLICFVAMLVGIVVTSHFLAKIPWVQRTLTNPHDRSAHVAHRAAIEFYDCSLNEVRDKSGVLIMISLMEREAVVLVDARLKEKFPPELWVEVCQNLIESIRSDGLAEGISQAIERCGSICEKVFPLTDQENKNEIPDRLVIKE